jgi:hypothetical protein
MNKKNKIKIRENSLRRQINQTNHIIKKQSPRFKPTKIKPDMPNILNVYNIWKWPLEIYEDIRQWKIVRNALREEETIRRMKDFKYELRTDRIGRIYTVINVPEELWPYEKADQIYPWVVEQLRELDSILLDRQLNDLLFPEVEKIEGSPAYLVILMPSTESIKITKFLNWLFRMGVVLLTYSAINHISLKLTHLPIFSYLLSFYH